MASHLEKIPQDVLQHIALLLTTPSVSESAQHLLQLLLTSSTIHRKLNVRNCPQLYADIFRTKFDLVSTIHTSLTDSALAAELLRRCRVLRRARRRDMSPQNSRKDLLAALRMLLESKGTNEAQLFAAGFPEFILSFVREHLSHATKSGINLPEKDTNALAIWLLCFTLSHQDIAEIPLETREELIRLLQPFTSSQNHTVINATTLGPSLQGITGVSMSDRSSHEDAHKTFLELVDGGDDSEYPHRPAPTCPDPSSAAIILIFALKEFLVLGVPAHVPPTRAIANATQRSGPTMEDFHVVASQKTPLFANTRRLVASLSTPSTVSGTKINKNHDKEFCQLLHSNYDIFSSSTSPYIPGTLTGVWDGSFMISGFSEHKAGDNLTFAEEYSCRKPMQCAISEYLCFSPHLPLPSDDPFDLIFTRRVNLLEPEGSFEVQSRKFGYQKYPQPSNTKPWVQRDPSQALDIVVIGETLPDHEQAWGGFRFAGRIRSDGLITIKREPKNADESYLGTWIFEGRLRYGAVFVGRLRSNVASEEPNVRGIFSLHKSAETWQRP